jgi:hypothetical protein
LFTAIIVSPILAITFLQAAQEYIKSNRKERVDSEKLVQVILPAKDVIWEEEGEELWIGNRMFDVSAWSIIGGNFHLTGVYDNEETHVAGSLLHLLLSTNGSNLLHLLFLLQCFTGCLLLINLLQNCWQHAGHFTAYSFFLPYPSYLVLSPPPQC